MLKIRTKLILLLSFSAAIALLFYLVASSYHVYKFEKESYLKRLQQLAWISSKNVEAPLIFDDDESARAFLYPLSIDDSIATVLIYNDKNEIFIKLDFDEESQKLNVEEIPREDVTWEYILVSTPILNQNANIGKVVLIASTKNLKQIVLSAVINLSFIAFVVLIIIILLSFKLQKVFSKPIIDLSEVMIDISKSGDYTLQVLPKYNDEFGTLYNGFNNMIAEINKKDANVHQLLDNLNSAKDDLQKIYNQTKMSIDYASLIQGVLVPETELLNNYFSKSFAIWHPKDKVSGDIYMIRDINENELVVMVLDCTGHGVSGAFLTILTKALEAEVVNSSIKEKNTISPAAILSNFNKSMKCILKQESKKSILNVGFDAQVIYFNKETNILRFSGARNPLYYIYDNKLHEIKGDKHSIGYKDSNVNFDFKEHEIQTQDGMLIYLATDGFWDQMGGEKKLPYGKKRFKNFLLKHHKENMQDQQELLLYELDDYEQEGSTQRLDDITIVGMKV